MDKVTIGWIGLGNMGIPIESNLLKTRNRLIVYNRTAEKVKSLVEKGAEAVNSPEQLAAEADIMFTMVSDDKAVKDVYFGDHGILDHVKEGKLLIDMSTVSPDTSRSIAKRCIEKGIGFLDAPVSGSIKPAQDGTLIILVGGKSDDYNYAKPLFDQIGKLSIHLGEHGAGSSAKLAINYLLGLNLQGLAETILFAQRQGISSKDMLTIINESACGNGITKMKSESILNQNFPAAFALKHLAKDLRLAKEQGMNYPLSDPLYHTFQNALQNGLGEEDVMAVIKYLNKSNS